MQVNIFLEYMKTLKSVFSPVGAGEQKRLLDILVRVGRRYYRFYFLWREICPHVLCRWVFL